MLKYEFFDYIIVVKGLKFFYTTLKYKLRVIFLKNEFVHILHIKK